MRLFIAIDLPKKIRNKIANQLREIKNNYRHYRWVTEKNYHLTTLFLGEINDVNKLTKIKQAINEAVWSIKPFFLYSRSINVFSNNKHIIYLEFFREKELEKLVQEIRNKFKAQLGLIDNKKFIPHLTLARGKRSSKQQYFALIKKLQQIKININFPIDKIILYQSIISPASKQPRYKKIASFPLND